MIPRIPGYYITNALKAKELFVKDVNYIVRDGEAVIVDEFTGRVMPGAAGDGQHQATRPKRPHRFRPKPRLLRRLLPELLPAVSRLAGMTGTAKTEEVEFEKTYKLETTIVPTNRVRARKDWPIRCTKPKWLSGALLPTNRRNSQQDGRCCGNHLSREKRIAQFSLAEQEIPHNLLNAKPKC